MGHDIEHEHWSHPGFFREREPTRPRDFTRRAFTVGIGETGGDNLAAQFSRELVDYTIYVIDVAGGDKIPHKGGPGITQSDLLVINKTDLAPLVGASLEVMARDATTMREHGPVVFAQCRHGEGIEAIVEHLLGARSEALRA